MKEKAIQFSTEWKLESNEKAEAQSFWNGFFQVFGISRRRVATFEKFVATGNGNGFIDLFWKGKLIVKGSLNRLDVENTPYASMGSMPNDNKNLILTEEEKDCFNEAYPEYGEKVIRKLISAREMINGNFRWCLWINDENTHLINKIEFIRKRVTSIKKYREASKRDETKKLAEIPYAFGEIRQPNSEYICIPCHSSERRKYIPMALFSGEDIVNNSCVAVHRNELYIMGILMSSMHMAWVKRIGGRIK